MSYRGSDSPELEVLSNLAAAVAFIPDDLLRVPLGTTARLAFDGTVFPFSLVSNIQRCQNQFGDNKFTDQARNVLALASEEARRYNHTGVGTEHLLLAILSEGEGIASRALAQLHVQENEI